MSKTNFEKQQKAFNDFVSNFTTKGFCELTAEELFTVNGGKKKSSSSSSSSSGNSGTKNTSSSAASSAVTAATAGASTGKNIGSTSCSTADNGKTNKNQNNNSIRDKNNTNSDSTKRESGWNQFIHGFLGIGNNDGNKPTGEKTTSSTDSSKNESTDSYQESYNITDTDCKKNTEIEERNSSEIIIENQQKSQKTDFKFNQDLKSNKNTFKSLKKTYINESNSLQISPKIEFSMNSEKIAIKCNEKNFSSYLTFGIEPSTSWGIGNGFDLSFKKEPNSIITTIVKTPISTHSVTLNKITVEFQIKL